MSLFDLLMFYNLQIVSISLKSTNVIAKQDE